MEAEISPCVGGKSESMDAVSSPSCLVLTLASDLMLRVDADDAERFGGGPPGCPPLERYCSIRFASSSLLSRVSSCARFDAISSFVISSWILFIILNLRTPRTTPANCALSRIGSAKFAPSVDDSSSVAIYEESTAWPIRSMAAATVGDCSESEKALYLAPSSAISAARAERWVSVLRLTFSMLPCNKSSSSLVAASKLLK